MKVNDAIKNIQNYYLKKYNIPIEKEMTEFLNSILQEVDSESWNIGYDNAKEDYVNE